MNKHHPLSPIGFFRDWRSWILAALLGSVVGIAIGFLVAIFSGPDLKDPQVWLGIVIGSVLGQGTMWWLRKRR